MVVSVVKLQEPLESLRQAIELCGGFEGLGRNDKVLIKPSICLSGWMPLYGLVITTSLLEGLVQLLVQQGCHDISIGEGLADILALAIIGRPSGNGKPTQPGYDLPYHFSMGRPWLSFVLPATMNAKSTMVHIPTATKMGMPTMNQTVIHATTLMMIIVTPVPLFPMYSRWIPHSPKSAGMAHSRVAASLDLGEIPTPAADASCLASALASGAPQLAQKAWFSGVSLPHFGQNTTHPPLSRMIPRGRLMVFPYAISERRTASAIF
jgi:hypothetical protein